MKQTIEQLRDETASFYVGDNMNGCHFTSDERGIAFEAFKDGAEWEYNRTKWIKVDRTNTPPEGLYLTKCKGHAWQEGDTLSYHLIEVGCFGWRYNDFATEYEPTVVEYCEIPK
jgi:hypothetical protein